MRHLKTTTVLALLLAAVLVPAPPAAAQSPADAAPGGGPETVHPFYAQLLEEGIYTYHRGEPAAAAEDLRLAVFGLLEEPALLAEGLTYLALAQQEAGENEAARETLGRLVAVEDRFGTWSGLELSPVVRRQAEELLMQALPEEVLTSTAGFRPLADESFLRRVAELPPADRLTALAQQMERRPGEPRWAMALARAELETGDTGDAARLASGVLADGREAARSHHPGAHCVLGLAAARNGDCPTVAEHLDACPRSRQETAVAAELLACQVELERWAEARRLLADLPAEVASQRPVARLARRVGAPEPPQPEPDAEAVPVGGASAADTVGGDDGGKELPAAAAGRLEEARRLLDQARRAGDLAEPLRIAREVADAHPASTVAQHLAGEIAYRASRWEVAARYYARGGEPARSEQRFYMAVALFESGDREGAAAVLRRALPDLPRTPFVTSYAERILGEGTAADGDNG